MPVEKSLETHRIHVYIYIYIIENALTKARLVSHLYFHVLTRLHSIKCKFNFLKNFLGDFSEQFLNFTNKLFCYCIVHIKYQNLMLYVYFLYYVHHFQNKLRHSFKFEITENSIFMTQTHTHTYPNVSSAGAVEYTDSTFVETPYQQVSWIWH